MNDWSARDLQAKEMSVGLGPAKGKDFATSLGPELVSPDELPATSTCARSRGSTARCAPTRARVRCTRWDELLAAAARNTPGLQPGDVIGSGTVGGGCILEHGDGRWLRAGDEVELEIEGLEVLRSTVA